MGVSIVQSTVDEYIDIDLQGNRDNRGEIKLERTANKKGLQVEAFIS